VRRAGQARQASVPLRRGRYTSVHGEEQFLAFARHTADATVLVLLNASGGELRRELEVPSGVPMPDGLWLDLLHPEDPPFTALGGRLTVDVSSRDARYLAPVD
jgi:hypothetical protein